MGCFQECLASCCCLKIEDRDSVGEWMLAPETPPPSLLQRLCFCQCAPAVRPTSGLEFDEQLRGLAGVTLQYGDHDTAGSLQTLKWGKYDPSTRVLDLPVFSGWWGPFPSTGHWTEPASKYHWYFLENLARVAGYTYEFRFSEDKRSADIKIKGNIGVLCCACFPCCPRWFTVPDCCVAFDMRESSDCSDGTHWDRYSSSCGGEKKFTYNLVTVINSDGSKGPYYEKLALQAPKQMLITF